MKNLDLPGPHEASESDAAAAAGHDGQHECRQMWFVVGYPVFLPIGGWQDCKIQPNLFAFVRLRESNWIC